MAYIKKKSERKFKITVCNGYKVNGQKRMKAQTITVPSSVPKRGIQQDVYKRQVQGRSCLPEALCRQQSGNAAYGFGFHRGRAHPAGNLPDRV